MSAKASARSTTVIDREPMREEIRVPRDRAVAVGRDGKPIWRRMTARDNYYDTIGTLAPQGWTYEWKTYTVHGMPDPIQQSQAAMAGWTPVPNSRHPGLFGPEYINGKINDEPIIVGASILMERPVELTLEAREEDRKRARDQVYNARAQRQLDGRRLEAEKVTFIREEIGPVETERPKYEIE